jgi:hypothetical protein
LVGGESGLLQNLIILLEAQSEEFRLGYQMQPLAMGDGDFSTPLYKKDEGDKEERGEKV